MTNSHPIQFPIPEAGNANLRTNLSTPPPILRGASVFPEQNLHSTQGSHWLTALCLYLHLPSSHPPSPPRPSPSKHYVCSSDKIHLEDKELGKNYSPWIPFQLLIFLILSSHFRSAQRTSSWVFRLQMKFPDLWSHRRHLRHSSLRESAAIPSRFNIPG